MPSSMALLDGVQQRAAGLVLPAPRALQRNDRRRRRGRLVRREHPDPQHSEVNATLAGVAMAATGPLTAQAAPEEVKHTAPEADAVAPAATACCEAWLKSRV